MVSGPEASIAEAIRVEGLEKGFDDWPVLWDLDLAVGWGELLVLLGANGVGKTTLLRILATQARADSGTVVIAGYNARRRPEAVRRRVGVVAHQTFLYDDLTCLENLVYYGRLYGLSDPRQRASEVLSRLGMAGREAQRVRTLSHGLQKRVAIARAILHRPPLLLLDEPETGLDPGSVSVLKDLLEEWTSGGRSVVMTTHNPELGMAWSDKVGVLCRGRVRFRGSDEYPDAAGFQELLATTLGIGR